MSMNFTSSTSRAENTGATGFDVDTISFLFWFRATAWGFGTLFAADEGVLGGGSPIWIHMDEGNSGVSFRYYRSGNRGHWVSDAVSINEWVCLGISYDRSNTATAPVMYTRRVGTHAALQRNATPTELQPPTGTANSPSAGYTVSDQDFPFAGLIGPVQVWNRILTAGEFEAASLRPGSIPNGLILYLNDRGIDLSGNVQNATLTDVSVGDNPPISPIGFEDDWMGAYTASASGDMIASLSGVGALSATLGGSGELASALSGLGAFSGTIVGLGDLVASLNGSADLSGTLLGSGALAVALSGAGSLSSTLTGAAALAAALSGDGSLTGSLGGTGALSAILTGVGSFVITTSGISEIVAALTASGSLSGTLAGTGELSATVSGVGAMNATIQGLAALGAALVGSGSFGATLTGDGALASALSGNGGVSATLIGAGAMIAALTGQGSLVLSLSSVTDPVPHAVVFASRMAIVSVLSSKHPFVIKDRQ